MTELFVVCIIAFGLFITFSSKLNEPQFEPEPIRVTKVKVERKLPRKKKQRPSGLNDMQKAAKTQLQSFGFSATEAKKMLEGIKASTVEQYVNEAMKKVKI